MIALPVLAITLLTCPPAAHPHIAVEAVTPYPGITVYAPHWGATPAFIAAAHADGQQVLGVHGIHDDLAAQAALGYDWLVFDEPLWQGRTLAQVDNDLRAVKAAHPATQVGVVEPYYEDIEMLLQFGARPDFVSGESYAGNIHLGDLQSWQIRYGVKTHMWVTGAPSVAAYDGRVDLVIAADLHGSWGGPDYDATLRRALAQTCRTYLPVLFSPLFAQVTP